MPIFNCMKRGGKFSVPFSVSDKAKEARMFSLVEASKRIQGLFSPKINTFKNKEAFQNCSQKTVVFERYV